MKAEDLALIARTLAPIVREFAAQQTKELLSHIAVLEQRVVAAEQRAMTPGPQGPAGQNGQDGAQGPQGPQGEAGPVGPAGVGGASGMNGKDGLHGKDGKDGITLGLDDLQSIESPDDGRTLAWKFVRDGKEKVLTVRTKAVLDRGVYDQTKTYDAGDGVTLGGSYWIALTETTSRPGTADGAKAWRLAVKKGQDGREGKAGPQGPKGPQGEPGTPGRHAY